MIKYRPEIDGLRAFSVLAVILYHAWPQAVPGGFVGVDVFFVISGFLITSQILAGLTSSTFSILEFYRRRIKRIVPVLVVVLAVTLVACQILMLPLDAEAAARSGLWAIASMANVYFWLYEDNSYFAESSDELPLLHLWSLGVEEQFYLIWPLLLLVAWRSKLPMKALLGAVMVVTILSFIAAELLFSADPGFTYYMLPTRSGELLLGAIAAIIIRQGLGSGRLEKLAKPMVIVGIILLFGAAFLVSSQRVFPGVQAVFPTVGATLFLFGGQFGQGLGVRFFSLRPLVFIGRISYSAYLWHWPIFSLLRYGGFEISLVTGLCAIVATLSLATMSYYWVEVPFRKTRAGFARVFAVQLVMPSLALAILCAVALKTDGTSLKWAVPRYEQKIASLPADVRPSYAFDYVCQRQRLANEDLSNASCIVGDASAPDSDIVLFGDSNAAHYVGLLGSVASNMRLNIYNLEIGACPPVGSGVASYVPSKRLDDCRDSLELAWSFVEDHAFIILAANWTYYQGQDAGFLDAVYSTVRELVDEGARVLLVGKAPIAENYDPRCREKAVSFPFVTCADGGFELNDSVIKINAELEQYAGSSSSVYYVDYNSVLCPSGDCFLYWQDRQPVFFNKGHITQETSLRLGSDFTVDERLNRFFTD